MKASSPSGERSLVSLDWYRFIRLTFASLQGKQTAKSATRHPTNISPRSLASRELEYSKHSVSRQTRLSLGSKTSKHFFNNAATWSLNASINSWGRNDGQDADS